MAGGACFGWTRHGELRDGGAGKWGPSAIRPDEGMVRFGRVPGLVSVPRSVHDLDVLGIMHVWILADPMDGVIRC